MILTIDQERFEEIVAAAASSRADVYEQVLPYMAEQEAKIVRLLTQVGVEAIKTDEELLHHCEVCVCTGGFFLAMRHLDLVLTETGFGVVSNEHVAPASADRVKSLSDAIQRAYDRAMCDILAKLVAVPGWGEHPGAWYAITQPMYHIEEVERMLGYSNMDAATWARVQNQLYNVFWKIGVSTGDAVLKELMVALRTNSLTEEQQNALFSVKATMVRIHANADERTQRLALNQLVDWFDKHADSFPAYVNDSAYKARHFERYENGAGKKAFFFG